jgi:hypothetical protein
MEAMTAKGRRALDRSHPLHLNSESIMNTNTANTLPTKNRLPKLPLISATVVAYAVAAATVICQSQLFAFY